MAVSWDVQFVFLTIIYLWANVIYVYQKYILFLIQATTSWCIYFINRERVLMHHYLVSGRVSIRTDPYCINEEQFIVHQDEVIFTASRKSDSYFINRNWFLQHQ